MDQHRIHNDGDSAVPSASLESSDPFALVKVITKRRWTLLTTLFLVFVPTLVYTFTATKVYEASVRLLIESDSRNVVNFAGVIEEDRARADYYQTQYNLLRSRTLAARTVDMTEFWKHPVVASGDSDRSFWKRWFGPRGSSEALAPATEADLKSKAIGLFMSSLSVSPAPGRLVDVRVRSTDPVAAARLANGLVRAYIEQTMEFELGASKEAAAWLGARLAEQRQKVEDSEAALHRYRQQHDAVPLEDRQNITIQKLADINAAVTKAKMERIEKESRFRQLEALEKDPAALDSFPAILSNGYLQQQKAELASLQTHYVQLAERLGEKHPDLIKARSAVDSLQVKLRIEIAKIVQAVRNEYSAALAQERSLIGALDEQKAEALRMNERGIEYGVLQREAESNRQIYESLMQRAKETGVSSNLQANTVRIVDPAQVPGGPVAPRPTMNLILGLFGGLMLGVLLSCAIEMIDNRLKTPEEIWSYLGASTIGMVPLVESRSGAAPVLFGAGAPAQFSEAFRTIRTNLRFSITEDGPPVIVITSTGPSEGKTLTSSNIAATLAQAGQRVLAIDADMRRPKLHTVFGGDPEPGLSNLLSGVAKASEAIRRTDVGNLWYLPAGRVPPNPSELLTSVRFKELLKSVREHFEWIIIDTPPVMAVTDATVVANIAGRVIFVVGAEQTHRARAKLAVDQLRLAKAKILGVILNRIDFKRNSYYYSNYHDHEYAAYYTPSATKAVDRKAKPDVSSEPVSTV